MKKYSKIIEVEKFNFRYNFEDCVMEWVTFYDVMTGQKVDKPLVVDCYEVYKEDFKESPQYWAELFLHNIRIQTAHTII